MNLDCEDESVVDESIDLTYNYENHHIFEPGKGMLGWAVERLKNLLGNMLILIVGKPSKSCRFSLGLGGGCITRTSVKLVEGA